MVLAILACCGVCAEQDCPWEWSVGPAAGVLVGDETLGQAGVDVALGHELFWGGVGLRAEYDTRNAGRPAFLFRDGYGTAHEAGLLFKWWTHRGDYQD